MDSLVIGAITLALMGAALVPEPATGPRWQFGASDTPGWALMSEAERAGHHSRMLRLQTYAECRTYMDGRLKALKARAKEQGEALAGAPDDNLCQRMSRAGHLR